MKDSQTVIEFTLEPHWDSTILVREQTESALEAKGFDTMTQEALAMCITELTENAIKYGNDSMRGTQIHAKVSRYNDNLVVAVSNSIATEDQLRALIKTIEALREAESPGELHIRRLREIMKSPKRGSSKLGIYRIAYEGDFSIDYRIGEGLLTVEATRKMGAAT